MINRHRQQGVLVFITPILLVFLAFVGVLLMDSIRLLLIQSKMQSVVNSAAAAAAEEARTCVGQPANFERMTAKALAAARRVGFDGDASELVVVPGFMDSPGDDSLIPLRFSARDPQGGMARTNSALVRFTTSERASSFIPEAILPPVELVAEAAARKTAHVLLSGVGSTLSVEGGLLGGLIGSVLGDPNFRLNATDLQSLETTLIDVGDLLSEAGLTSVTELAETPLVDTLRAVTALAGGAATPAGDLADRLTGALGIEGLRTGDVITVVGAPPEELDIQFPVYDLAISTVMAAAHSLSVSNNSLLDVSIDSDDSPLLTGLQSSVGLLAGLDLELKLLVDKPAKMVLGSARQNADGEWVTRVSASDITLEARVKLDILSGVVGSIDIPLLVRSGGGDATLENVRCAAGASNLVELGFRKSGNAVSINTGRIHPVTRSVDAVPITVDLLNSGLGSLCRVETTLNAALTHDNRYEEQCWDMSAGGGRCDIPAYTWPTPVASGLNLTIPGLDLSCAGGGPLTQIITQPVEALLTPLTQVINAVTGQIVADLIAPLLTTLGADLGGISIRVLDVEQTGFQLVENIRIQQ